jgi:hypothetical protein
MGIIRVQSEANGCIKAHKGWEMYKQCWHFMTYDTIYRFNCNWVYTRWQQYITHVHPNNTHNTEKGKFGKCRPCPIFASYTLAFALQLRKKHG